MFETLSNLNINMQLNLNLWNVLWLIIWLMAILNPFSTIPYYIALHPNADDKEVKSDSKKIAFSVFSILFVSWLVWTHILKLFWLEIIYFKIAGWLILSYMAFSMVKWDMSKIKTDNTISKAWENNDYITRWLFIPLAMPLTSWPWTIAYVIWISHWTTSQLIALLFAIWVASFFTFIVLRYWVKIKTVIWELWIRIITRFMWLILLGLGIQIMMTNILDVIK